MRNEDKAKFLNVLQGVYDFYGKELSEFAGQVWLQAVESCEIQQVTKALSAHLMDPERGQFMPKPADLVRQLHGTHADRSLMAWGKLLDAMQRVGAYTSVVFDDPVIHSAVEDLGGWITLCRTEIDELPFVQKRFCDGYRAYSAKEGQVHPASLPGEHELTNKSNGRPVDPPTLIGNPERAGEVLRTGVNRPKTQITQIQVPRLAA